MQVRWKQPQCQNCHQDIFCEMNAGFEPLFVTTQVMADEYTRRDARHNTDKNVMYWDLDPPSYIDE